MFGFYQKVLEFHNTFTVIHSRGSGPAIFSHYSGRVFWLDRYFCRLKPQKSEHKLIHEHALHEGRAAFGRQFSEEQISTLNSGCIQAWNWMSYDNKNINLLTNNNSDNSILEVNEWEVHILHSTKCVLYNKTFNITHSSQHKPVLSAVCTLATQYYLISYVMTYKSGVQWNLPICFNTHSVDAWSQAPMQHVESLSHITETHQGWLSLAKS